MADILISGIQFPKFSPHVIEIYPNGTAIAQCKGIYGKAVSVPPHGDLIDRDEYRDEFMNGVYALCSDDPDNYRANAIIDLFDNAPSIIPASEVE